MPTVKWSPTAQADLEELAFYIGVQRRSPKGAASLVDTIRQQVELYAQQPLMGQERPELGPGLRSFAAGPQRNHVVIYKPSSDGIFVVRVFEGHRHYPSLFRDQPPDNP